MSTRFGRWPQSPAQFPLPPGFPGAFGADGSSAPSPVQQQRRRLKQGSGSAVSLSVHPDLQQFFGDQSVRLNCQDPLDPDGSVVKRVVGAGTLGCRERNQGLVAAYFFFNGSLLLYQRRRLLHRIQQVQQADRGFYHCSTDELGSSARGLLRVKDPPTTTPRTRTRSSSCVPPVHITLPPFSTIIFLPLTVLGALLVPLVLLVLVVVVMLWRRQTGQDRSSPAPDVTYAQVNFRKSTRTPSRRSGVGPVPALDCGYTECCDPSSE
ncbi:uncharacterized protein V3H82_013336 [Fundulus diaphanus]